MTSASTSTRKLWPALLSGRHLPCSSAGRLDRRLSEPPRSADLGEATSTEVLGEALLGRFVVPFEVVSFLLLAALIGGITIARKT